MEVALAAGVAGAWSAYMASVNEGRNRHPVQVIKEGVRRVKALIEPPPANPADVLAGLPVVVGEGNESLECDRSGLDAAATLTVANFLKEIGSTGTLLHLNLSRTQLTTASALIEALAGLAGLRTLRLRGCALGDAQTAAVCEALCRWRGPDAEAPAATLEELELPSNGIGAEGASKVGAVLDAAPRLRRLDLSYNRLGRQGCVQLAQPTAALRELHSLILASNQLDDAAVADLALALRRAASPLQELDLEGNSVADGAMQELLRLAAASTSLSALRVAANSIGAAGGTAISSHLVAHPHGPLRSLGLSNNPLGAAGASLVAALGENQALTDLAVRGAGLSPEQEAALDAATERNRQTQKEEQKKRTKSLLRAISAELNNDGTAAAAPPPARIAGVVHAAVAAEAACHGAVSSFAAAPEAATPLVAATPPAAVDTGAGTSSEALPPLNTSPDTPSPISPPAASPDASPGSGGDGDGDGDGEEGAGVVPGEGGAEADGGNEGEGSGEGAGGDGGEGEGGVVRGLRELRLLPGAATVLLADEELGDEHAAELADYVRYADATRALELSGNNLTDSSVPVLGAALGTSAVVELSLAANNLEGANQLGLLLGGEVVGRGLRRLNLADNLVGPIGAASLAEALPRAPLVELRLEANLLGDEGAAALADALTRGSALLTLGLQDNRVGDDGGAALAAALPFSALQQLALTANQIGEAGIGALVRAARAAASLQLLDLRGEEQRVPAGAREAAAAHAACRVLFDDEAAQ